jgi:cell division protein FtsZ
LFNPEDLDNDNIISMVETIPTFQRSKDMLENIQTRFTNDNGFDQADAPANEEDNVIHFS